MHDIFYFTDIHGMYNLYRAVMDYCYEQDPEAIIIFGGDAIDRGKDGYRIMKELLNNPKVCYLKGNHEDLFVLAARFLINNYNLPLDDEHILSYLYHYEIADYGPVELQASLYNGGFNTLYDWMKDGMPQDIVDRVDHLPLTFSYGELDFCHAGGRYSEFARISQNEYNGTPISKSDKEMVIWDRNYLGQGWIPGRTCVFGHTPVIHLAAKYYGKDKSKANMHPCAYNATLDDKWTGRKIDMDTGAFASEKTYVLNCLTMKAQGFHQNVNNEIEKIEVIQF